MLRSNLPGVSILGLIVALGSALVSAPATAQEDLLSRAEQAYVDVDFAAALSLADEALETGAYGPRELERIYRLIGVAATASGDDERAVTAYVRLFALNPEAQLDENLSPRLRQPFLEALGRWTALRGRLGIQLRRLRDSRGLGLTLEDPISLVARVVVFSRIEGRGDELARTELTAGEPLAVAIAGLAPDDSIEVYAQALDAHGNRVLELGSAVEPHVLEGESATAEESTAVATGSPTTPAPSSGISPWFFVTGAALTAVSAAVLSWSIVDVVESHDAYLAEPTLDGYYQGLDLQTRTNALIITTSALGIASALLAIFTEWSTPASSTESARMDWTFFASPTAAGAAATGSF